jgi:hypothetical protein
MMKVTMSLMRVLDDTMKRVSASKWKRGKTVLMVERFRSRVEEASKPFTQAHQKLLSAYVEPDEAGNLSVPPEHPKYQEVMDEFSKMLHEVIDFETMCFLEDEDLMHSDEVKVTSDDLTLLRTLGLMGTTYAEGTKKIKEIIDQQNEASSLKSSDLSTLPAEEINESKELQ